MSDRTRTPHDRTDLYLAPVALALDSWLATWSEIPARDLHARVSLATNEEPRTESDREQAVVHAMAHEGELHGGEVELVSRGVRLYHATNELVLGLPENLRRYIVGASM
jgi:hypothetical protein